VSGVASALLVSASALALRPYQAELVERVRHSYRTGHAAPLVQLATGGGKTWIFTAIVSGAVAKGNRTMIVVHTRELIRQTCAKLEAVGVRYGILGSGLSRDLDAPVLVATVQSLVPRLPALPAAFAFIVFDEAHHCRAAIWRKLLETKPQAKLIGFTATPARTDGRGLGIAAGGPFDDLIIGPSTGQLIAEGWLSPVRVFAPAGRLELDAVHVRCGDYVASELAALVDTKAITGDAVADYRRRADHQPAIAFCPLVSHAEHVAAAFREAGYRAACVEGRTRKADRDRLIGGLGTSEIEVLTSCDLISEGLDVPAVGCVILLRPTKSLVLHRQQIGRGMRPAPGKDALIVNDHVGNCLVHGLPQGDLAWSLDGIRQQSRDPVWTCPQCGLVNEQSRPCCEGCGYERATEAGRGGRKAPAVIAGELDELTPERLLAIGRLSYRQLISGSYSEAELRAFAQRRGYRNAVGWVRRQLRDQRSLSPNERLAQLQSWVSERRRRGEGWPR
jgi:superfamily II DNA or RNA helicase